MKLAFDISAGEAQSLVGTDFYTLNGSHPTSVTPHKCVAIYTRPSQPGYGIRLVNENGERMNPASGSGIYTDLSDVADVVIAGYEATIERLRAQASSLTDQLAATTADLEAAIALRDKVHGSVPVY
jgi:hypothetical protein